LLQTIETQNNIQRINQSHLTFENAIKNHPKVKTTRVLGVIFALQIKTNSEESYYGNLRNKLYAFFIESGIILRPVGNIIYILPPYIITEVQLQKVYSTIEKALEII
jgi:adenosylmethionine-8-amino-7-oxononanoate aminotransferase